MDDHFVDFALIVFILAGLIISTIVLLFLYSKKVRRPFSRCLGSDAKTHDVECGIPPKRTTIRVVKSLPNNANNTDRGPISPTFVKPPARRVASNPPIDIQSPTSPSQKFVFIYPKRSNYQSDQATIQSSSTRSSYLPTRRSSR